MAKQAPTVTAAQALAALKKLKSPARAKINAWFFKTTLGAYGHGDVFWGVSMPQTRAVAKNFLALSLADVLKLLKNPVHEVRMLAAVVLVGQYRTATTAQREKIYQIYLKNATRFNNWDLVDVSAPAIVGAHLYEQNNWSILKKLARSANLWERRIAIVATYYFIRNQNPRPTFAITRLLLTDSHDLIHKACGWMLREVGKNCGPATLKKFLQTNYKNLPRTALRYAIEHYSAAERQQWLTKK